MKRRRIIFKLFNLIVLLYTYIKLFFWRRLIRSKTGHDQPALLSCIVCRTVCRTQWDNPYVIIASTESNQLSLNNAKIILPYMGECNLPLRQEFRSKTLNSIVLHVVFKLCPLCAIPLSPTRSDKCFFGFFFIFFFILRSSSVTFYQNWEFGEFVLAKSLTSMYN